MANLVAPIRENRHFFHTFCSEFENLNLLILGSNLDPGYSVMTQVHRSCQNHYVSWKLARRVKVQATLKNQSQEFLVLAQYDTSSNIMNTALIVRVHRARYR